MQIRNYRHLFLIILLAFVVRLVFVIFIGKHYFGRDYIFEDGDTRAWSNAITNLIEFGVYTSNSEHEYGYFGRMPGYSFFLGIFYIFFGPDWIKVFPIVGAFQILLDLISVYFVFRIAERVIKNQSVSLIAAGLYALYPFIVVWNPVCYSETLSIFLLLFAFHIYLKTNYRFRYVTSGAILGFGCLVRPQLFLLFAVILLVEFLYGYKQVSIRSTIYNLILLFSGFSMIYGLWPARNYLNHGKLIMTQDLRGFPNWNVDVISFMQYMFSIGTDWNPQFTQIIKHQKVEWPEQSLLVQTDSAKLRRAEHLAQYNGSGFSYWKGYSGNIILPGSSEDSSIIISNLFNDLRASQMREFPFNFWVKVPLKNLNKAIFKQKLNNNESIFGKLSIILFTYRTSMILLGLIGLIYLKRLNQRFALIVLGFFVLLYFSLSFGTSPQFRNIEIRYFLPVDILLLIPASIMIHKGFKSLAMWVPGKG